MVSDGGEAKYSATPVSLYTLTPWNFQGWGETYKHGGERLKSWSSSGQEISGYAKHRGQGHIKNQVCKILALAQ